MIEVIFLWILGMIWVISASIQDLRKREIANWLSFSLIVFALGFRFFYSFFTGDFNFFYQGLIGLGIFFVIGNLFYHARIFAGGDTKLMIALGPVLAFKDKFISNLEIFALFFLIFLFVGSFYGLLFSLYLSMSNFKKFKKEFSKYFRKSKKIIYSVMFLGLIVMLLGFFESLFFILGVLIFISSYLYVYAKAVDKACMMKKMKTSELTEGDWLAGDIKVGKKIIKADWNGLTKPNIYLLKKRHKTILIKQGIPFVPVFFITFLILICFIYFGFLDGILGFLRNSFV